MIDVPHFSAAGAKKKDVIASPDKHSRSCALQCSKAGYGALVDGKFVKVNVTVPRPTSG